METPNFTHRKGLITITDRFEDLSVLKPEKVIVHLLASAINFDVGALCYRSVDVSPLYSGQELGRKVDDASLDPSRREAVNRLIDYIKSRGPKTTNQKILAAIKAFQNWVDERPESPVDFSDQESIKRTYQDYTAHLINLRNLPKTPKNKGVALTNNTASVRQKRARIWCHCITGVPLSDVEFWATRILWSDRQQAVPKENHITLDECNKTMSGLIRVIGDAYQGLVKNKQSRFMVGSETFDFSEDESTLEPFLKKVISVTAMSFIAATGANRAVALGLRLADGTISPGRAGMKFIGVKDRAGGKEVLLEFGAKYLNVWKKYLEIRELYLNGESSDFLFPYRNSEWKLVSLPDKNLDREHANPKRVSSWFTKVTARQWVTAREFRKHRDLMINKVNKGDVVETAEMQGRSVGVTLNNYQHKDLTIAANEISRALNLIYEAAIKRTRSQESIVVKIVEGFKDAHPIPTGQCASESDLSPSLALGFTAHNPVVPDCRAKETCIFCEHYAVHADREDLWKLLSLRFLCEELKNSMGHDEFVTQWSPVIYRIDEIIDAILKEKPSLQPDFDDLKMEVELGYLDDFWSRHIETLMSLGVIA